MADQGELKFTGPTGMMTVPSGADMTITPGVPPSWIKTEWQQFKASKTVKAVIGCESIAILVFVDGLMDGTQKLTLDALKGWLLTQAVAILILTLRHCFAGIEVMLESKGIPKEALLAAEAKGKALAIQAVAETHPELAAIVTAQLK